MMINGKGLLFVFGCITLGLVPWLIGVERIIGWLL